MDALLDCRLHMRPLQISGPIALFGSVSSTSDGYGSLPAPIFSVTMEPVHNTGQATHFPTARNHSDYGRIPGRLGHSLRTEDSIG